MIRPWIKVCGITRTEDALAAVRYGARAVGFILDRDSSRYIEPAAAHEIIEALPPRIAKVGVTVNVPPEFVWDLKLQYGFTTVQAHGEESPEECGRYPLAVVKAMRCAPGLELYDFAPYSNFPILLDGYVSGQHGGTGVEANWDLAQEVKRAGFRVLLAGGLGPHNVLEAIEAVEPAALDFNSAVESEPGIKDYSKLEELYRLLTPLDDPQREMWPW